MIRVLDTNVIVSAYLNPDGLPFFITKLALAGIVQLCSSEPILAEYEELLQRKSYPLDRRRGKLLLDKLRAASTIVKPAGHLSGTSDPDDNIFWSVPRPPKPPTSSPATPTTSPRAGNTPRSSLPVASSTFGKIFIAVPAQKNEHAHEEA
jgi:putative PIN family toxin of toxin-antitoxin system